MKLLVYTVVALILLSTAQASDAPDSCPPIDRHDQPAAPVYVVLYGYPHSPTGERRTLNQVDEDLLLMTAFFGALGPRRIWIHGESEPALVKRFGSTLRTPNWRSLRESIAELNAELQASEPGAQVYLYFAGHGSKRPADGHVGGLIYGRPEPDATEPGFNGAINGGLIAREILAPLSAKANVHLIVDTCLSIYLLTARNDEESPKTVPLQRIRKAAPPLRFAEPFAEQFPQVGATLAGDTLTYETPDINGLFSHALRTAAVGTADLNQDGLITYGELHYALIWLLGNARQRTRPTVVSPGLDREAIFINWRQSPAARICLPSSLAGTHVITTPHGRAATLPLHPQRPSTIWLHSGERYTLTGQGRKLDFLAADGALEVDATEPGADYPGEVRSAVDDPIFPEPFDLTRPPFIPPEPPFESSWYVGAALSGAAGDLTAADDGIGAQWSPSALLAARLGHGRHRLAAEGGWTWLTYTEDVSTPFGARQRQTDAHVMFGRIGYDHLLTEQDWGELAVAALIGGMQRLTGGDQRTAQGVLRTTAFLPMPKFPLLSFRLDARLVLVPSEADGTPEVEAQLQIGAGVDIELPID